MFYKKRVERLFICDILDLILFVNKRLLCSLNDPILCFLLRPRLLHTYLGHLAGLIPPIVCRAETW